MNTRFSIIVPVYGVEQYLRQCVASILDQTFRDFEVFLVDDGSTDGSGAICDEFERDDDRVNVIHQPNAGAAAARNSALSRASGEFVIFIDGDDFLLNRFALELVDAALTAHDPEILVVAHRKYWDGDPLPAGNRQETSGGKDLRWMLRHEAYLNAPWDKIIRLHLLQATGIVFPEQLRTSDDAVWCSELLLATDRIRYVDIQFYGYRQRSGSITASLSPGKLADLHEIFTRAEARLAACDDHERQAAYGAYFARYFAFLMAATQQDPTDQHIAFLRERAHLLRFSTGRRARVTRATIRFFGMRGAMRLAALAQRKMHRRRTSG